MKVERWTHRDSRTVTRGWQTSLGRLRVRVLVHHHRYLSLSDRWVVSPTLTYDRKRKR